MCSEAIKTLFLDLFSGRDLSRAVTYFMLHAEHSSYEWLCTETRFDSEVKSIFKSAESLLPTPS